MELEAATRESTSTTTTLEELSEGMSTAWESTARESTRTTLAGHGIVGIVSIVEALAEFCQRGKCICLICCTSEDSVPGLLSTS